MIEVPYLVEVESSVPNELPKYDLIEHGVMMINPDKVLFARTKNARIREKREYSDNVVIYNCVVLELTFGENNLVVNTLFSHALVSALGCKKIDALAWKDEPSDEEDEQEQVINEEKEHSTDGNNSRAYQSV